ncbi:Hypothetical predicted protein [Mytilus galloprovincialis]|uniref:Uncharacterized protein n=1 Tax=Mytilus galloprovincialis TaxID=29158 RepID=A0A8B6D644_MYTGA|nr:Hypothetical predicted protein [Mytilus galloprovincialis]
MGNVLHGSSRRKVNTITDNDINSSRRKKKTTNRYKFRLTKSNNKLRPLTTFNQKVRKPNDEAYGFEPATPRHVDVNRFETSDRRKNDNTNDTGKDRESSGQKESHDTNTALIKQSDHSPRNERQQNLATLGKYDEQVSQITTVGSSADVVQTVHHTHQYNIQVAIHSPSTEAIVIGNQSTVNISKKERNKRPAVDHIEFENTNITYTRREVDEFSLTCQKTDGIEENIKKEVTEKIPANISKGSKKTIQKLQRSTSVDGDPFLFRRSKSNRKSARKRAYTLDTRSMLRNFQWNQYEMIQESLLRSASHKIKKCESEEKLTEIIDEIKTELQNVVEKTFSQLQHYFKKSMKKAGYAEELKQTKERIVSDLKNNSRVLLSNANDKLLKLKDNRIHDLGKTSSSTSNEIIVATEERNMTIDDVAKRIKSLFSTKITSYVSTLLPLKIQQEIIVYTFECQKSFVIKKIMTDFVSSDFSSIMKYVLNPNEYAKKWILTFTNQKIFYKESPESLHIYADIAKQEIKHIVNDIKASIAFTKHQKGGFHNLSDWAKCFLHHFQDSNSLPLSSTDFDDLNLQSNLSVKEFIEKFLLHLKNMKAETIINFKNTTVNDVQWSDNPHNKIIESLWGCTECCPFCNEPCQYSDKEHVTQESIHKCIQHRPLGVYGYMNEENNMFMLESCISLIKSPEIYFKLRNRDSSLRCTSYDQAFKGWEIRSKEDTDECKFWKFLICRWKEMFQQFYSAHTQNIPVEWTSLSVEDAIRSLNETYICS